MVMAKGKVAWVDWIALSIKYPVTHYTTNKWTVTDPRGIWTDIHPELAPPRNHQVFSSFYHSPQTIELVQHLRGGRRLDTTLSTTLRLSLPASHESLKAELQEVIFFSFREDQAARGRVDEVWLWLIKWGWRTYGHLWRCHQELLRQVQPRVEKALPR